MAMPRCSGFSSVALAAVLIIATGAAGQDGNKLSQEEFLSVVKTKGEFKQADGSYTVKAKKVDGRNLIGVEVHFENKLGMKVKLTGEAAVAKFNDEKELELFFEKCELESGDVTATLRNSQYWFPTPTVVAKPKP